MSNIDLETNGLRNCSVLSATCENILLDLTDKTVVSLNKINRYYFRQPNEQPSYDALKINKLYDDIIERNRGDCNYPKHFVEDVDFLNNISGNYSVGHNIIAFDSKFINKKIDFLLDTMILTKDIVKKQSLKVNQYKNPKLTELVDHFFGSIPNVKTHTAEHDVYLVTLCLEQLNKHHNILLKDVLTRSINVWRDTFNVTDQSEYLEFFKKHNNIPDNINVFVDDNSFFKIDLGDNSIITTFNLDVIYHYKNTIKNVISTGENCDIVTNDLPVFFKLSSKNYNVGFVSNIEISINFLNNNDNKKLFLLKNPYKFDVSLNKLISYLNELNYMVKLI